MCTVFNPKKLEIKNGYFKKLRKVKDHGNLKKNG